MSFSFNPRNYLFFKIFIWFWLTILITLTLLFVFAQLSDNNVESRELKGPKLANLQRLATNLERAQKKKPTKTLAQIASHPRIAKHRLLLFINPNDGTFFYNQNAKDDLDTSLLAFSYKLPTQYITTAHYRAHGPIKLSADTDYLLFEINPWRTQPLGIRVMLMPRWLKVIVIIGATLLLSLLFNLTLIKPINRLKDASSKLAKGQLDTRVKTVKTGGDELNTLSNDFNQMAQRLESLVSSQKRLMADVSHELRSPLTRLQMATGLAQLKQTNEQKDYLTRIEKEANNLEKMIADVLKLARLEANNQYIHKEEIPLHSILEQVIKDATFESEQKQKSLYVTGSTKKSLRLDGALIASAIENILRNAISYADKEIHLQLEETPSNITITIWDDGPGVIEAELPYLLEPFYRVSQSRQRKSGGAGLGLAIAKHAIDHHNGNIALSNQTNAGLKVTIVLNYE